MVSHGYLNAPSHGMAGAVAHEDTTGGSSFNDPAPVITHAAVSINALL